MPTRGEEIDRLLKEQGRSAAWLGRKLGRSRQVVHDWIAGRSPHDLAVWDKIADALGVPSSVFMEADDNAPDSSTNTGQSVVQFVKRDEADQITLIPYWGTVPAGDWDRDSVEDGSLIQVSDRYAGVPDIRAVRVGGDSMEPRLFKGEVVIVRLSTEKLDGVITLVVNQDNELTLKVLRYTPDGWMLESINPAYGPAKAEQITILGHAIGREEFDRHGLRA